jgi:protein gp37
MLSKRGPIWTGEVRFVPEMLDAPLRWRKPRMVFVASMSDLFHGMLSDEQIATVFGVMAACPQHTFQVLTKRAQRMLEWFSRWNELFLYPPRWHIPNVWIGVSVENQATADKRIPMLLQTPAAVRFVSAEPFLGPIDLEHIDAERAHPGGPFYQLDSLTGRNTDMGRPCRDADHTLDWVIAGSESGPGARQMDLSWAESLRDQCHKAKVPFFTKQIANQHDRKGGDPQHWPGGPWPREWPEVCSGR